MANSVETKVVEANDKIPDPIFLRTKTNEVIVMEATSNTTYDKSYFSNVEFNSKEPLTNPRRVKKVTLPININGKNFYTTLALFVELTKNNNYTRL